MEGASMGATRLSAQAGWAPRRHRCQAVSAWLAQDPKKQLQLSSALSHIRKTPKLTFYRVRGPTSPAP